MPGTYEVHVQSHFSAAHRLCGYAGDCARIHGHNWVVEVYIRCNRLDEIGIAIDFRDVKRAVSDILHSLDHQDLNELSAFRGVNPTSENVAKYLYGELSKSLNTERLKVSRVSVYETPGAGVAYWED